MQRNRLLSIALFVLCLSSPVAPVQADESISIEPFEVEYLVQRDGIPVGESRLRLEYPDNGHYRMSSKLRLNALVRLFFADSVDEEVDGELIDGRPLPLTYQLRRGGKKARTVSLEFDWTRGEVAATKNGAETTLRLQPRSVDSLSLHLLVMSDLQAGASVTAYSVVSGDRLRTYRGRLLGKATMKTPLGQFETLMISRQRDDSNKVTTYWHAPELGFLPVHISTAEDGAEVARLIIQKLTILRAVKLETFLDGR